jgi:hypothetical protein
MGVLGFEKNIESIKHLQGLHDHKYNLVIQMWC